MVFECLNDLIWDYNSCLYTKIKYYVFVNVQPIQGEWILFGGQSAVHGSSKCIMYIMVYIYTFDNGLMQMSVGSPATALL
jgi:hypothetical protein